MSFDHFSDTNENIDRVNLDTPEMSAKGVPRKQAQASFTQRDHMSVTLLNQNVQQNDSGSMGDYSVTINKSGLYDRSSTI